MLSQKLKIVVLLIFICGCVFVFTQSGKMHTNQKKTAGEVYKNIQVLKDVPAEQWDRIMATFAGSLGVKCNFCHVPGQPEKDDKEQKQTARRMIKMMFAINRDNFDGRTEVSCATCHQGKSHPSSIPPLGQNPFQPSNSEGSKEAIPTIDQILDKYVQAVGGKAAEKVTTRVLKGSRIGADGVLVPEEVYVKMPDKMLVVTTYPQFALNSASNGSEVWTRNNKGEIGKMSAEESEQFKREAQLLLPMRLKEVYKDMSVVGTNKINDKEAYIVLASTQTGGRERLYFDKQTGLLVRRSAASQTVVGIFPFQVDYSDYKAVDGVQIPMTIQWSIPGRVWGRKITEVKQNVAIEDAKFNPPAK